MYRLECGVRQGGLSSPNLYVNDLIVGLSGTGGGCSIGGVTINNISYAEHMVLLSPAISGLRKLVSMCEEYAVTHGLKYNTAKNELLVYKAGNKVPTSVPEVNLCGCSLNRVTRFKYLGHWVNEGLQDEVDMEQECRALVVRCNMLARRFARCERNVSDSVQSILSDLLHV
ncbi:uncharacterized protein LOC133524578 [Cydia pomonella]|uniref:uncharacterized protein LOC133524578 n=1 Tax=Cydia pomonella TaxID=82600 RepID=UPI002ADDD7DC|nr:uncharacterized protein LOC133524578 [Cydia pomonella]